MASFFQTGEPLFDLGFPLLFALLIISVPLLDFLRPASPIFYKWNYRLSRIILFLTLSFVKGFQIMIRHFPLAASWNIHQEEHTSSIADLLFGYNTKLPLLLNMFSISLSCLLFGVLSRYVHQVKLWLLASVTFQFVATFVLAFLIQKLKADTSNLPIYILYVVLSCIFGVCEALTRIASYKLTVLWYEPRMEYAFLAAYLGMEDVFELWFGFQVNTLLYEIAHKVETMLYTSATFLMLTLLGLTIMKVRPELRDDTNYYLYLMKRYLKRMHAKGDSMDQEMDLLDEEIEQGNNTEAASQKANSEGFVKMEDAPPPYPSIDVTRSNVEGSISPSSPMPLVEHPNELPDLYGIEEAENRSLSLSKVISNPQLWIISSASFITGIIADQMRTKISHFFEFYPKSLWLGIALQSLSLMGFMALYLSLVIHICFSKRRFCWKNARIFNVGSAALIMSFMTLVAHTVHIITVDGQFVVGAIAFLLSYFGRIVISCLINFSIFDIAGGYKHIGFSAGLVIGSYFMGSMLGLFFFEAVMGGHLSDVVQRILFLMCDIALVLVFVVSAGVECVFGRRKGRFGGKNNDKASKSQ